MPLFVVGAYENALHDSHKRLLQTVGFWALKKAPRIAVVKLMDIKPGPRDMEILLYGEEGLHKVTLLRTHRFLSLRITDLYDWT